LGSVKLNAEQNKLLENREKAFKAAAGMQIQLMRKFIGNFTKAIRRRPAEDMDTSEKEQVKEVLKPVIEFYDSL
jgi:hypothetical protein